MKSVTILGSTGSIGANTLAVLALHPEQFRVFALTAHSNADKLFAQCLEFRPNYAVLGSAQAASSLQQRLRAEHCPTEVLSGPRALDDVAAAPEVDLVMAAIVGAAGLSASLAAARAGKRLLLANKESLVVAGDLLLQALAQGGGDLIPIDSEHSAIQQSLPDDRSRWQADVRNIVLTASGGPFRQRAAHTLQAVTPTEACAHPNWSMGAKISVDSATMMNKALEVIEAHYLFGMRPEQIEVLIHPQSIVHSMVNYHDGSVIAQLGLPDMRTPIAYGLSYPARMASGAPWLDLARVGRLDFEQPDPQRFPGLALAFEALRMPVGACAVLNAANEVAVDAFLHQRIRFTDIHRINADLLASAQCAGCDSLEALAELDVQTRLQAQQRVAQLSPSGRGGAALLA
ncbi:MAG: 1-deoxy-D-xylulose-5-phosphate reductoisomerase [Betaproteobacteria bacterium]|nr:1-deoxy-D-xylulose-5-phosphate reductoisomerase [Betaproteobacteria bacterium]